MRFINKVGSTKLLHASWPPRNASLNIQALSKTSTRKQKIQQRPFDYSGQKFWATLATRLIPGWIFSSLEARSSSNWNQALLLLSLIISSLAGAILDMDLCSVIVKQQEVKQVSAIERPRPHAEPKHEAAAAENTSILLFRKKKANQHGYRPEQPDPVNCTRRDEQSGKKRRASAVIDDRRFG